MIQLKHDRWNYYNLILTPLFFISFFLYVWLRIDPVLYYQSQEPIFFFNNRFFHEHLLYPGGLTDYIAAFLSQFYYFSWAGALILTIFASLITLLTRWLIQTTGMKINGNILIFIPSLLILASHSQYEFLLANTVGFFFSLLFSMLYIRFAPTHQISRFLNYILLALLLYFLAGAAFFLFVLLSCLYELLFSRRTILGVLTILSVAGLPYLAGSTIFLVSMRRAYLYLLPFNLILEKIQLPFLLLFGFYPLILLSQGVITMLTSKKIKVDNWNLWTFLRVRPNNWLMIALQIVLVVILFTATAFLSYNKIQKKQLLVDHYAQYRQWGHVLEEVERSSQLDWKMIFQANRAMYHLGRFSSELFSLPQLWGDSSLVMIKETGFSYPLQNSHFYYDLGLFNEAEHWAHESMSIRGETGWTLEQLAMVNIIKGEFDAAHVFISRLNQSLLFKRKANQLYQLLNDSTRLLRDPNILDIRSRMPHPERDFIYYTDYRDVTLERVLKNNPSNKMAFEYLMAFYLFKGNLVQFVRETAHLKDLGYRKIPRHYQEALLLYISISGKRNISSLEGYKIDGKTVKRFKSFQDILKKFRGNKNLARNELYKTHRDTYWFYAMYYKPKETL